MSKRLECQSVSFDQREDGVAEQVRVDMLPNCGVGGPLTDAEYAYASERLGESLFESYYPVRWESV